MPYLSDKQMTKMRVKWFTFGLVPATAAFCWVGLDVLHALTYNMIRLTDATTQISQTLEPMAKSFALAMKIAGRKRRERPEEERSQKMTRPLMDRIKVLDENDEDPLLYIRESTGVAVKFRIAIISDAADGKWGNASFDFGVNVAPIKADIAAAIRSAIQAFNQKLGVDDARLVTLADLGITMPNELKWKFDDVH